MFKEFKEFAMKGNVVDLAVAVIIGAAFGKIVTSLVEDIIMPVVGKLTGGLDFSNLYLPLSDKVTTGLALADAQEAGRRPGVGQLCHHRHQLPHHRVLHFPRRESAQQHEEARLERAGDHEGLSRLHDDDSDQGNALPALHHSAGGVISRPSTLSAFAERNVYRRNTRPGLQSQMRHLAVVRPADAPGPRRKGGQDPATLLLDKGRKFQS